MNLAEYQKKSIKMGFVEYPASITPGVDPRLPDIVNFEESDIELKKYLATLILGRCFPYTGAIVFDEPRWFITHFLSVFKSDLLRPGLTKAIRRAMELVTSEDTFGDNLIGTTFLFGILEYYAKHVLSGKPRPIYSFNDTNENTTSLDQVLGKLQKKALPISAALNEIDKRMCDVLRRLDFPKEEWEQFKLVKRVYKARNDMLHGNRHSYYSMGEYMAMLYILFHLYDLIE